MLRRGTFLSPGVAAHSRALALGFGQSILSESGKLDDQVLSVKRKSLVKDYHSGERDERGHEEKSQESLCGCLFHIILFK